jgi:hypothetical protein
MLVSLSSEGEKFVLDGARPESRVQVVRAGSVIKGDLSSSRTPAVRRERTGPRRSRWQRCRFVLTWRVLQFGVGSGGVAPNSGSDPSEGGAHMNRIEGLVCAGGLGENMVDQGRGAALADPAFVLRKQERARRWRWVIGRRMTCLDRGWLRRWMLRPGAPPGPERTNAHRGLVLPRTRVCRVVGSADSSLAD